jgi:hypothetical protein
LIYERVDANAPIRQGDIFLGVPRVELSLGELPVIGPDEQTTRQSWRELVEAGHEEITCLVTMKRVDAIVISQDCDTFRGRDISLCEMRPFAEVEGASNSGTASSWMKIITQQARKNLKWFYLPIDVGFGIRSKLAVDFQCTIRLPRLGLESLRGFRAGRLNSVADEHFRERLAEYFRRYPYDEWYPLDPGELAEYLKSNPGSPPYPWQSASGSA